MSSEFSIEMIIGGVYFMYTADCWKLESRNRGLMDFFRTLCDPLRTRFSP